MVGGVGVGAGSLGGEKSVNPQTAASAERTRTISGKDEWAAKFIAVAMVPGALRACLDELQS